MGAEKKGAKNRATNGEVLDELAAELKQLRGVVREAGERFVLRREGEIETLISHLAAIPATKLRSEAPGWLLEIRSLRLKPAKGRLKDLKGFDRLIEGLMDRIISPQENQKS
jgi:hypothetical protein